MERHVVRKKRTPSARCPTPGEGASEVFSGTWEQLAALGGSSGRRAAEQGTRSVSAASFGGHLPRSPPCRGSRWVPDTAPRPHLSAAGSRQHEAPMPGPQSLAQRRPKVQPLRGFPRHPPPRAPAPRWGRTRSLAAEFGMLGGCTARSVGCHLCPRPVSVNVQPRGKIRQGREPTSWAMLPQTEAPVTP